mmetsp:Transcript_28530/g.55876  ORF Transcript_28530/g.55876 Transcript_28530/m.55876 type:complete len:465 (+) Transcript_28530:225-1619(+)
MTSKRTAEEQLTKDQVEQGDDDRHGSSQIAYDMGKAPEAVLKERKIVRVKRGTGAAVPDGVADGGAAPGALPLYHPPVAPPAPQPAVPSSAPAPAPAGEAPSSPAAAAVSGEEKEEKEAEKEKEEKKEESTEKAKEETKNEESKKKDETKPASTSLFNGSLFSAPPVQPGTQPPSLFSGMNGAGAVPSLFGGATSTLFPQTTGPSLFGAGGLGSGLGAPATGGTAPPTLFGSGPTPAPPAGSLFGGGTSLFGVAAPAAGREASGGEKSEGAGGGEGEPEDDLEDKEAEAAPEDPQKGEEDENILYRGDATVLKLKEFSDTSEGDTTKEKEGKEKEKENEANPGEKRKSDDAAAEAAAPRKSKFVEIAEGFVSLLQNKETKKGRVVVRQKGTLKVQLNVPFLPSTSFQPEGQRTVRFHALNDEAILESGGLAEDKPVSAVYRVKLQAGGDYQKKFLEAAAQLELK